MPTSSGAWEYYLEKSSRPIKWHPVVVGLYNIWLSFCCLHVQAYVFVATTGRSGTTSLTRMFEHAVDGSVCFHEPPPIMNSSYPRGKGIDREKWFEELFYTLKRTYIKRAARKHKYYVETNHQFIKNFAIPAITYFGDKIRIIHVRRDPVSVASSFYSIDSVPGKTNRGINYMLDPDEASNIIQLTELCDETGSFQHDLYKCLWYWYETEARVKMVKRRFPHVRWFTMTTNQLNDKKVVESMFASLDIPVDVNRLEYATAIRENLREEEKEVVLDRSICEEMNEKLKARIEQVYGEEIYSG